MTPRFSGWCSPLAIGPLSTLSASRLRPPRSGLERSDFVQWPVCEIFSHLPKSVWSLGYCRLAFLIVEPRSMLVAESDLLSYSCRVVGARNVESNCRLGLRSVLRHCAVGAGRLRPLVGHAVGISASFSRRRSNPHPRRYVDHRRSARSCGFICPFCAGGAGDARPDRAATKARRDRPLSPRAKSDLHRGRRSHFWSGPFVW